MTTRGGVSKAQKGLHLNEDIYAGMNALLRGGRIKHCEYYQCGKGRDLGFGSILNFTTKIGTGMGEQMLSREYYYLGTQLPLDRFLSFYYFLRRLHASGEEISERTTLAARYPLSDFTDLLDCDHLAEELSNTMVWQLANAWPSKVTGTDLKAQGNEVAVESIVISHEGLTIENK